MSIKFYADGVEQLSLSIEVSKNAVLFWRKDEYKAVERHIHCMAELTMGVQFCCEFSTSRVRPGKEIPGEKTSCNTFKNTW